MYILGRNPENDFKIESDFTPLIRIITNFIVGILAFCGTTFSQTNPVIWHIPASQYQLEGQGISPQIRQFLQLENGQMLMANTTGMLVFDGRKWSNLPETKGTRYRIAKGLDGLIYASNNDDIGTISPNQNGQFVYTSLLSTLPDSIDNLGIFQIVPTKNQIHFIAEKYIYSWQIDLQRLLVKRSPGYIFHACSGPNQEELLLLLEEGLYQIGNTDQWIFRHQLPFKEVRSMFISAHGSDVSSVILMSIEMGIWELSDRGLAVFSQSLTEQYPKLVIYHSIQLNDGRLAIATNKNGIIVLDPVSREFINLSQDFGITTQPINQLYQDRETGLWLAGDNFISRFPYPLPLTFWGEEKNIAGVVTSITKKDDQIYVGTTQGFYSATIQSIAAGFTHIQPNIIRGVWDICQGKEGLWIAATSGLFLLNNNSIQRFSEEICMSVRESRFTEGLLVVGTYEGLMTLKKEGRTWSKPRIIPGIESRTESLLETANGEWWICYKELSHIKGLGIMDTPQVVLLGETNGWTPDLRIMDLSFLNGEITLGSGLGRYLIDPENDVIKPDSGWNQALPEDYVQTQWTIPADDSSYWVFNGGFIGKMTRSKKGYVWNNHLMSGLRTDVWTMFQDDTGELWIGTNEGLGRYQPQHDLIPRISVKAYFKDILIQRDSLIAISSDTETTIPQFKHGDSDLFFSYSATGFTFPELVEFQFKLDGYDDQWSDWSKSTEREKYIRLWEGRYTFRVRARNLFGQVSPDVEFSFIILPPWYRSWWALFIYLGIISFIVFVLVQFRTRAQRKRLAIKERELALERQTTERLRAIDRLKDQFLANTSHELKTPLNGIIGLAESLYLKENQEEDRYSLGLIVSSGKRLQSLVNDILDFSKLKSHEIQLSRKKIDLKAISDVVIDLQRSVIGSKPLTLQSDIPESFPLIIADEGRITQVLHNLVANAIKFTEEGEIRIKGEETKDEVIISVEDTGIGISAEHQLKIFKAFEQADGSIQRQYAGTGLGLTISRQLVELHGGSLSVTSSLGEGSVFSFSIPKGALVAETNVATRAIDDISTSSPHQTPSSVRLEAISDQSDTFILPPNQNGLKILIVDDEEINLEVMKAHLTDPGLELVTVTRGKEALNILDNQPDFDLVLLDVMMPGMSGFEVCRQIRKKHLPSELPVIIITAKDQIEDLVQAFSIGANDYIAKPFSRAEFLSRVKTQLHLQTIHHAAQRFVPTEFLTALGYEAITETRYGDQVQRMGTVLFSDIRNYTTIAEQLSPEETFHFLNAYYSRMGPVIRENHGFINQFVGDGIMALFLESSDDAVRASIGMIHALQTYNIARQARGFMPIAIGMGLHTGQLMMGIIGDGLRMDAGLVSDTVNTAARMEGLTKLTGSSILLTEDSYLAMKNPDQFSIRYLGRVNVKGKEKSTAIYDCLDILEEEIRQVRLAVAESISEAFSLFEDKKFDQAMSIYQELLRRDPEDKAVQFLLQEVKRISLQPDDVHWRGTLGIMTK